MLIRPSMLSSKWPKVALGEIVEFLDHARRPIAATERAPGPYPYYGANGQQDSVADYIFDEPLLLLAEDGGHFGAADKRIAYRVSGKCWVNNHAHVLRPKPELVDLDFLRRTLERYDVTSFVTGTTRAKLTKAAAARIPVALPPLADQRRIADILDKADDIRRKRREAVTLTEALLRSTFLELFGDPVTNPSGWEVTPLRDAVTVKTGRTPSRKDPGNYGGTVPWVKTTEVRDGLITQTEESLSERGARRLEVHPKGSLVIAMYGQGATRGRTAMLGIPATTNQACAVLLPSEAIVSEFLWTFLRMSYEKLRALGRGGSQANLNLEVVRGFPVLRPPRELQARFAGICRAIQSLEERQRRSAAAADELFHSLVERAFRGDL